MDFIKVVFQHKEKAKISNFVNSLNFILASFILALPL